MNGLSEYFRDSELACESSGIVKLDPRFAEALAHLRAEYNRPMIVNSCCRSVAHNQNVGGAKASYHLFEGVDDGRKGTLAIDVRLPGSNHKHELAALALPLGWSVLVYENFLHLDWRVCLGKTPILLRGGY